MSFNSFCFCHNYSHVVFGFLRYFSFRLILFLLHFFHFLGISSLAHSLLLRSLCLVSFSLNHYIAFYSDKVLLVKPFPICFERDGLTLGHTILQAGRLLGRLRSVKTRTGKMYNVDSSQ